MTEAPPEDAVNVTVSGVFTAEAVALNPALVAPAATVTVPGTARSLLLLLKVTSVALVAAPLRYTEHPFVVGPVSDCVPQEIERLDVDGTGAGYNCITVVAEKPAAVAVNVTFWGLITFDETALNPALAAPAETVTADGTVSAGLLLESDTRTGAVAPESRYTEQDLVCGPVSDCVPQEIFERLEDAEAGFT